MASFEVDVDQGPLGHEKRKPTTLGTNLCYLKGLANVGEKDGQLRLCLQAWRIVWLHRESGHPGHRA